MQTTYNAATMQDIILKNTSIHINESHEYDEIERCGIGGRIWKSSVLLSSLLKSKHLDKIITFENKTVLEIGSGAGICGIVCATLNVNKVIITDRDPGCLLLIEKNIELNLERLNKNKIEIKNFDWGNNEQIEFFKGKFDILIGSDLIYSQFMIEMLCKALESLCTEKSEVLLTLADRGGEQSDFNNFIKMLQSRDRFDILIIPEDLLEEKIDKVKTLYMKKKALIV